MVNSYQLVNPYIQGKFKTEIKALNSQEAANLFYNNLSKHFNNSIPQFNFTIQKGTNFKGKYYHFQVKEIRKDDEVSFSINELNIENNDTSLDKFKTKLENFKSKFNQKGGKKKSSKKKSSKKKSNLDDSESSESSKSESSDSISDFATENIYKRAKKYLPVNQPIYYWWYDPYVYRLDSVYIPTFYSYITPYIELSLF